MATHLRSCLLFAAWLGRARDVLEDRFGVQGGSGDRPPEFDDVPYRDRATCAELEVRAA